MNLRRLISLLSLAVATLAALASAHLDEYLADPGVNAEGLAVLVVDLASGKVLDSHHADMPLIPASVMKCVTTASLIGETGTEWHYVTRVYTEGRISEGALHGNLVVVGSGDPSLGSPHEPRSADFVAEIVEALKAKGVGTIRGRIVTDGSVFPGPACPPTWASGDLGHAYGTGCHGLNFESNASGQKSVQNPAAVFERRLRTAFAAAGIAVEDASMVAGERTELVAHTSAPIDEIMRSCMMRSDNLFAEALLRTYALTRGKEGATQTAADLEMKHWKGEGLPMRGVNIVDGSGLSRSNRLTARFLAEVLRKRADNVDYASFFPLAGQEGTLRKFLKDTALDSYIAMKTGSMNGIQCYAGYRLDDDFAPTHVVVVMANDMKNRAAFRAATERYLLALLAN